MTPLQTAEHVVAMARTRGGEYLPLTSKALHTIVKAGVIPADFDCLYPYKRAKDYDTTAQFANYQHRYVLDDTGGGVSTGATHRRVAAEVSGNRGGRGGFGSSPVLARRSRCLLLSKNSRVNTEVVAAVRSVVVAIERSKLCRVLRLDTEFVLDEGDELWLVGVTSCKVAARPALAGAPQRNIDQQGGGGHLGEADRALATELRSKKHEADETSDVLSDDKFSKLLRRVGYQSPTKSRTTGGGSDRHRRRPRARLNSTIRNAATTGVHAQNGGNRANVPGDGSIASLHGAVSDAERSAGSTTVGFDWAAPDSSEGPATSYLGENTEGGASAGGATGRSPSPPRPEPIEMFDSSVVKLDQAATNRIYGSTQVRAEG